MKTKHLIALILLSVATTSCGADAAWKGWVYPDSSNLENYVQIGPFASFEACQESAQRVMSYMTKTEQKIADLDDSYEARNPDYECGYKCEFDLKNEMNVCEKTAK